MDNTTKERFIRHYRMSLSQFVQVLQLLLNMQSKYDALDLGNALSDDDFIGENAGITKAEFLSAISSVGAIDTLGKTGHYTNIFRVVI